MHIRSAYKTYSLRMIHPASFWSNFICMQQNIHQT